MPLRLPRPRFTLSRLMIAVASAAYASAVGAKLWRECLRLRSEEPLFAAIVVGMYGWFSMRHPWLALPLILCVVEGMVQTSGCYKHLTTLPQAIGQGCIAAWIIGALAGWITRRGRRLRRSLTHWGFDYSGLGGVGPWVGRGECCPAGAGETQDGPVCDSAGTSEVDGRDRSLTAT